MNALPLDAEDNPNRNLGKIPQSRTLVMVDSPQKLTGLATLKRAQELHLSTNTIRTFRTRILDKIGLKGTNELIHYAIAHNLTEQ